MKNQNKTHVVISVPGQSAQESLQKILESQTLWKTVAKRELDRSVGITIDASNPNKLVLEIIDQDSGRENMTPTDVSLFLNITKAAVLRLNAARAQSRSRNSFPKGFLVGKEVRWYRPDVVAWRDRARVNGNGEAPTLKKGRR